MVDRRLVERQTFEITRWRNAYERHDQENINQDVDTDNVGLEVSNPRIMLREKGSRSIRTRNSWKLGIGVSGHNARASHVCIYRLVNNPTRKVSTLVQLPSRGPATSKFRSLYCPAASATIWKARRDGLNCTGEDTCCLRTRVLMEGWRDTRHNISRFVRGLPDIVPLQHVALGFYVHTVRLG